MKTNNVVIISGITSFLGSNLSRYLLDNGYEVYGIIRDGSKGEERISDIKNKIRVIKLDLCKTDKCDYKDICQSEIDELKDKNVVFLHMAWDSSSALGRNDIELQKSNYQSSINASYLSSLFGAKKFIFTSSQAEDNDTPYGIEKKKFAEYGTNNITNFLHLRIFSVYGKNDYHRSLINYLYHCADVKENANVGKCEHMWNYLYIEDFVKMMRCFIDNDVDLSKTYDIASDDTRELKSYVNDFANKYHIKVNFDTRRTDDEKFSIPDISDTIAVIGKNFRFSSFLDKI